MIEEIRIRDLGVITDATLNLSGGFTVVTGETGAGKTMVVTALGLLLGARADAGAVRLGAKAASAEAVLRLAPQSTAALRAAEAGGELEESDGSAELIVARTVNGEGRSRAYVGGRSAPAGVLAELGAALVVVHGQSDQLRLKSASAQREALDKFAGPELAAALNRYQESYRRLQDAVAELDRLRTDSRERLREAESLQAALEEIEALSPQPGEDENLKAESMRLGHVEELRTAAYKAHQALVSGEFADDQDATVLVDAAKRQLESAGDHDPALAALAARLAEVGYILTDISTELSGYSASLDSDGPGRLAEVESRRAELAALAARLAEVGYILTDISTELSGYSASLDSDGPGRLAEVESRRAELAVLVRKYAPSIDEVLEWAEAGQLRLGELGDDSTRIEALTAEIDTLEEAVAGQAAELTALRTSAAATLAERVTDELSALAMAAASLVIDVTPGERSLFGADSIAFLLQPHPGSAARPLGKGASGGELSRVMLAIEVVLAAVDPVPTFVFDEVDAGVGGKAAVEIGRRLAMLAEHVQVIVVTHLPQVAAFASQHIRVTKNVSATAAGDGVTASDVEVLPEAERVRELARMLAGQEESASAQAHAEELLADAARTASKC